MEQESNYDALVKLHKIENDYEFDEAVRLMRLSAPETDDYLVEVSGLIASVAERFNAAPDEMDDAIMLALEGFDQ